MIALTQETHILLAVGNVDFRKQIDGLAGVCQQALGQDPRSGTVFVFLNRRKTQLRCLTYDGSGFWLMTKRLSRGQFTEVY